MDTGQTNTVAGTPPKVECPIAELGKSNRKGKEKNEIWENYR